MSRADDLSAADLARHAAAYGLPGAPPLPDSVLDDVRWHELVELAAREGIIGVLAHAVADSALLTTSAQRRQILNRHTAALGWCLILERALARVVGLLERAEFDYRVLKGPSFAHTTYPDSSWRTFGDVDVLVRADNFYSVVKTLLDAGYRRRESEVAPGFDRRFGKGATLVDQQGVELDVHHTFVSGPYGIQMNASDLFESYAVFHVKGVAMRCLGPTERFVNACYHASLGGAVPRLGPARDVVQMMVTGTVDRHRLEQLSQSWRAEAVVGAALSRSIDVLGVDPDVILEPDQVAYRETRRDVRLLGAYTTHRSFYRQALLSVGSVTGAREKSAYCFALARATPQLVRHTARLRKLGASGDPG